MAKTTTVLSRRYRAPKAKIGDRLRCKFSGTKKTVEGFTRAPVRWPAYVAPSGERLLPIVCGDLVEAIKTESAKAIVEHWGVTPWTVQCWRKALGVRLTAATFQLWREAIARNRAQATRGTKRWKRKRRSGQ